MASFTRLLDTIQVAMEVQRVFIRADMCTEYRNNIMEGNLNMCLNDFTKFRERMQFYRTNVLVVDSSEIAETPPLPPEPPKKIPPPTKTKETELMKDTEVLKNKDIETDSRQLNTSEFTNVLPNSNIVLALGPEEDLCMVPAITVDGTNGINLKSQKITIIPEKLFMNIKKTQNDGKIIKVKPQYYSKRYRDLVLPRFFQKKRHDDFLMSKILQKTTQEDLPLPQLTKIQQELPLPKFKQKKPQDKGKVKKNEATLPLIVDCRTDKTAFSEEIKKTDNSVSHVKLPIRTNSAVDWEDKIPIEVISFADDD
ncbi:PREDICTED: uncharacterized protein LOC106099257 isoform X2 [Papilio polytes]|nr:PREDICTED: uncharacterized protein LOC106099257 isoform X2 [Papilio polytes]